jgi:hypothetical protein
VTTISAIPPLSSFAGGAAVAAGAAAGAGSPRAAMENAADTAPESNSAIFLVIIFLTPRNG